MRCIVAETLVGFPDPLGRQKQEGKSVLVIRRVSIGRIMPTKSNRQLIKNLHRRMKEGKLNEVSKILSDHPDLIAKKHHLSGMVAAQIARGGQMKELIADAEKVVLGRGM